ncbi:MAG TPA: hypothetical protein VM097_03950 [Mycobacteriales bacterium]|nr:hypothetical protein [Mycobacteriales bacterium]
MAEASFTLLLLAFVGLACFAAWWSWAQAKKRRELFRGFALSQGWRWTAQEDSWCTRFSGTPFGTGDGWEAKNVLEGTFRQRPMVAFDYSYDTHSTDTKGNSTTTTHRYAVCALSLPSPLPEFELVPEGLLGRVGTLLGMQDIELESEDFNRRFRVRCGDPKLAYDLLPARTMEALLARPAQHVRLFGADALCWEDGTHSPSELLARLDTLSALLDGVPAYVWSDRKGTAP